MPKTNRIRSSRTLYLKQRGGVWWLKLPIPRPLRVHYRTSTGKPQTHIEESLGTGDLPTAIERRDVRLAYWRIQFRTKGRDAGVSRELSRAGFWREAIRSANDDEVNEQGETERDIARWLAEGEAERIGEREGTNAAQTFSRLTTAPVTLREAWSDWLAQAEFTEGTKGKYTHTFDEFLGWLKVPDEVPAAITPAVARSYVKWLNTEAKSARGEPLAYRSKKDRVTALSSFWVDYLEREEIVRKGSNPWERMTVTGKRKSWQEADPEEKRAYREDELLKLFNGPEMRESGQSRYPKRTLMELNVLGLLTGARLDEICDRRLKDIEAIEDGYVVRIVRGKREASIRSIPVLHPIAVEIIRSRIGDRTDPDEQLFAEFIPGGRDKKLSWYPQRALGRYRDKLGFGVEVDFQSTRRSFITRMEELEADPVSRMRYTGHKPQGTHFDYSRGTEAQMIKIARTIHYPKKIEDAMREALK